MSELATRRWQRLSRAYRRRNPLCVLCRAEGYVVAAREVDHIIARRDGGAVWDERNLQSLCRTHHMLKTRGEQGAPVVTVDGTVTGAMPHPAQGPGITARAAGEGP